MYNKFAQLKKILISGINGFLGSLLAKKYSKNYDVIGLEYENKNLTRISDENFEVYSSKNGISDALFKNTELTM